MAKVLMSKSPDQDSNLLYLRYRSITLVVYAAVLLAGFVDWLYGGIGPRSVILSPAENLRFILFVLSVCSLIAFEIAGVGKSGFIPLNKPEPFLLIARLLLFLGACLVTDLNYSKILFLPILLYSYFAVSKSLSYVMAVLGSVVLFGYEASRIDFTNLPPPPPSAPPLEGRPPARVPSVGPLIDRNMGSLITLLFTLLLARTMSQSIQAQHKLSGLLTSLEASHSQLQHYASRVAGLAATEERNRLARDIHDSLGHHLAAINIQLAKANAYRERDPNRAYEAVTHAQHAVQDALKDVRESVGSLRQEGDTFSFYDSVDDLIQRMQHSELTITFEIKGDSSRYSRLKQMILYRVVQEGLTNVHKHAHASQVKVTVEFGLKRACLDLVDNGSGFDVDVWKAGGRDSTLNGLSGLQERLSLAGGQLSITSGANGTHLKGTVPQSSIHNSI